MFNWGKRDQGGIVGKPFVVAQETGQAKKKREEGLMLQVQDDGGLSGAAPGGWKSNTESRGLSVGG